MPFTDNNKTPDRPEDGVNGWQKMYIERTKNIWIRLNLDTDQLEVWSDGIFQASYSTQGVITDEKGNVYISAGKTAAIVSMAEGIGKAKKAKEIANILNDTMKG